MDAPIRGLVQPRPLFSALGYLHPADVHVSTTEPIIAARQAVLDAAYAAHPERFRNKAPIAAGPPTEAWINKPDIQTKT